MNKDELIFKLRILMGEYLNGAITEHEFASNIVVAIKLHLDTN